MLYKYCGKCHQLKPVTDFSKNKNIPDGYENCCKVCTAVRIKNKYDKMFIPVDEIKVLALFYADYKPLQIQRITNYKLQDIRKVIENAKRR